MLRRGLRFLDSARKDIFIRVTIKRPWGWPDSKTLTGVAGAGENGSMPSASAIGRRWLALGFALTQTLILAAVACSSGAATAPDPVPRPSGDGPATAASNTPEALPAAADDMAVPVAVPVKVGSSVGEHIPNFELRLSDGAGVSSAALLGDRQPAFLFFFATW